MAGVSFPSRCAVAVVCGEHLISQVYPASVPVEVFIDNVVELLHDELKRRGLPGLGSDIGYELHKANGVRLDVSKTLDELGVEDGATLILVRRVDGDSFEPQYESLSTGLARIGKALFESVSAEGAAHTALVIAAMATATVLGLAVRQRAATDSLACSAVTGAAGLLAVAAAVTVRRRWPHRTDLLGGFGWQAVPLLAVSLAAAAPGALGSAHLFIAALTAAMLACAVAAAAGHLEVAATALTLCALGGAAAAARMWLPVPAQVLGMCTLTALLLVLTLAPNIALWCARIRPPHFGSITGRDLFRRSDALPADTVEPVSAVDDTDQPTPDTTARGAQIAAAAVRANSVLTGICVGAAAALPAAVWATLAPGRGVAPAVLAGLFVVIFLSRARAYADKRQAVALVCGAAAAVCVGVATYAGQQAADSAGPLYWGAAILAGFAGAGLAAGLLVPVTTFTPLVRMATEWAELAAIIAALPLAAWIGGLFTWVRMR